MLTITIPGKPVAKARPRVFRDKNGFTRGITPEATVKYEEHVKLCAMEAINNHMTARDLFAMPLKAVIDVYFPCPTSQYRKTKPRPQEWRTKKPDADNLAKAILDALNGIVYHDDSQVVDLRVRKYQAAQGDAPRVEVVFLIVDNYEDLPF
jgi:Holliday junction resolvase RusA-like endonuclease